MLGRCLRLAVADPNLDAVLLYLGTGYRTGDAWVRDLLAVRAETEKPVVVIWTAGPEQAIAALRAAGMYVFDDPVRAIRAVHALVQFGQALNAGRAGSASRLATALDDSSRDGHPAFRLRPEGTGQANPNRMVPEMEARALLAAYGIPVARHALARSASEAADLAGRIGFPVALKVVSADLPHKTEAEAVRLGVRNPAEAAAAYEEVVRAAQAYRPGAAIDGVLVEEMVAGGVEVIVGALADPQFGPTVLFGLGGVFAEVLADTGLRLAPIDRGEALAMIREVKGFPLLAGARGRPPADIDALADALVRVSELAVDHSGELVELDLNPLMALPEGKGVRVVDVLALRVSA